MTAVTFDTLKFVKTLKMAGVPELHADAICQAQHEVFTELAEHTLATKADIAQLQRDITQLQIATKEDITQLQLDIAQLQLTTKADITELQLTTKAGMSGLSARLRVTEWMGGVLIAGVASLILNAFF